MGLQKLNHDRAHTHTSPSTHTRCENSPGGSLRFLCTFKSSVSIVCEHFWLIGGLVQKDLKKCQWLETSFQHPTFLNCICCVYHNPPLALSLNENFWFTTASDLDSQEERGPSFWMSCRILFFSQSWNRKALCVLATLPSTQQLVLNCGTQVIVLTLPTLWSFVLRPCSHQVKYKDGPLPFLYDCF